MKQMIRWTLDSSNNCTCKSYDIELCVQHFDGATYLRVEYSITQYLPDVDTHTNILVSDMDKSRIGIRWDLLWENRC